MKPILTVDLFEARVSVSAKDGLKVSKYKYRTKFTGKNYISIPDRDTDYEQGYRNLYHRVVPTELLKVQKDGWNSTYPYFIRSIYYLEGQEDQALKLLRAEIEKTLTEMEENTNKMLEAWLNRK
jgi:hypothetical protein